MHSRRNSKALLIPESPPPEYTPRRMIAAKLVHLSPILLYIRTKQLNKFLIFRRAMQSSSNTLSVDRAFVVDPSTSYQGNEKNHFIFSKYTSKIEIYTNFFSS